MSVSAIFGSMIAVAPIGISGGGAATIPIPFPVQVPRIGVRSNGRMVIVCSSRPTKKATAHHMKTRPRKTQPWDIKRKPTVYPPLPPLPPDWTLVSAAADNVEVEGATPPAPPASE